MAEHKSRYELFLEDEARKAEPTKECSRCHKVKVLSEYSKDKSKRLGIMSACKECYQAAGKRKYKSAQDRFWKTYHKKTVRNGDCIEWAGRYSTNGTPMYEYGGVGTTVSRLVYHLGIAPVSDDMLVLHTCNNKRCVRHSHLKLATQDEARAKLANSATGWNNWMYHAKITPSDVVSIRQMRSDGVSLREISQLFGISEGHVREIARGMFWTHIDG